MLFYGFLNKTTITLHRGHYQQFSLSHLTLEVYSDMEFYAIEYLFKHLSKLEHLTFKSTETSRFCDGTRWKQILSTLIKLKTFNLFMEIYNAPRWLKMVDVLISFQTAYYRDHKWNFEYVIHKKLDYFRFYSLPYYENKMCIDYEIFETKST
ncbi:unnamed protein product, partial [Didymodactylos carnosus]